MKIIPNYRKSPEIDPKTRLGTAACISSFVTWSTILCAMAISGIPFGGGSSHWGKAGSFIIQPIKTHLSQLFPKPGTFFWALPAAATVTLLPAHSAMAGSLSTECPITLISGWMGSCATLATTSIILEKNITHLRGAQLLFLAGKAGTATTIITFAIFAAAQHKLQKRSKEIEVS